MSKGRVISRGEVLLKGAQQRSELFTAEELIAIGHELDRLHEAFRSGEIKQQIDVDLVAALPKQLRNQVIAYLRERDRRERQEPA